MMWSRRELWTQLFYVDRSVLVRVEEDSHGRIKSCFAWEIIESA